MKRATKPPADPWDKFPESKAERDGMTPQRFVKMRAALKTIEQANQGRSITQLVQAMESQLFKLVGEIGNEARRCDHKDVEPSNNEAVRILFLLADVLAPLQEVAGLIRADRIIVDGLLKESGKRRRKAVKS